MLEGIKRVGKEIETHTEEIFAHGGGVQSAGVEQRGRRTVSRGGELLISASSSNLSDPKISGREWQLNGGRQ